MCLLEAVRGESVRVAALQMQVQEQSWLRAVGIFEGQKIVVLRRAPFGGPLHVRTGSGGEFAVDGALARMITVTRFEELGE